MKIKYYGTSASECYPSLFCECDSCKKARELKGKNIRTRSCMQIDDDILIDFSSDTTYHIYNLGLDLTKINHILISHSHPDHFCIEDLACIFYPMAKNDPTRVLHVYGNKMVGQKMKELYGKEIKNWEETLKFHEVEKFKPFKINDYTITPLLADHMDTEEAMLYIVTKDNKSFLYGHDSTYFPESTWEELKKHKLDCMSLDCTSIDYGRVYKTHMGFEDNLNIKKRMIAEGIATDKTIFIASHFAHSFYPLHDRLTEIFKPHGFIPAYDGLEISF